MHCSYNHSALLEFDFDPLKAGAKKKKKKRGASTVQDALASSGAATQLRSIQIDLTAAPPSPAPEAWCQADMERKSLYHSHTHSLKKIRLKV